MKFRVARDDLADAVAWVAQPADPPAGAGARRHPARGDGRRGRRRWPCPAFDYEVSARVERRRADVAERRRRVLVSGRLLADITRSLPAKPVDLVVDGSRVHDHLRRGPVHACRPCRSRTTRTLPPMPELAGTVDGRRVRRGRGAGRGRRRPRRHAADADRHPGGDRRREADAGRHRPVPAGRARAGLDARADRACPPRCWSRPARWPTRRRRSAGGRGDHRARPSGRRRAARPGRPAAAATTTRLLDVEFPKYPSLLPTAHTTTAVVSRSPAWSRRSSGWRWSPTAATPVRMRVRRRTVAEAGRRRRRRGQRRGGARRCGGRRRADDRVQPGVPARRPRRAAHRHAPADLHHAHPAGRWSDRAEATARPTTPHRPRPIRCAGYLPPADARPAAAAEPRPGPATPPTRTQESSTMQLGLIGLGKMGGNMRERLRRGRSRGDRFRPQPERHRRRRRSPRWSAALPTPARGLGDGALRRADQGTPSTRWPRCSRRATWSSTAATRATPTTAPHAAIWPRRASAISTPACPAASGA